MAKYRKIETRIWNDAKFRSLSDNGKLAFFFVLTHPHMTSLGAMRGSIPGLASEIGWPEKAFREAFREALSKGMAKHDEEASFVWLPNFLKYNRPESPNVVKAWGDVLDLLPECHMKLLVIQHVNAFAEGLTEGFRKALPEAFAKSMPYQEQEQEQEIITPPNPPSGGEPVRQAKSGKHAKPNVEYPPWLDAELWEEFKKHRVSIKARMTPLAERKAIAKLRALIDGGGNQREIIEQSIMNGWKGLFDVDRKHKAKTQQAEVASLADRLREEEEVRRKIMREVEEMSHG